MAEPVFGVAGPVADLVGRDAELEVLARALAGAEQDGPCVLAIRGEPGIGKSRLLAELAARAAGRGHAVLAGRAGELERDLPFAVLAETLEPAAVLLGRDALAAVEREQLEQLAVAVPAVARLAGVEPGVAGERHRVARGVRALLEALAVERPLTVLLDDVHWADPASTEVLALLVHRPPRARVLIGLAARSGRAPAVDAAVEVAARAGVAAILELSPLSSEAADAMLAPVARSMRERLYRESGGNPFYLEELARVASGGARVGAQAPLVGVPRAVAAALAGELSELAADTRRLLEGAAVAGDPFELDLAAAAADLTEGAALSALDELLAADLARATAQPRRFRFRHPLVRRAVYEAATGGWKLAAHARAAEALEARGATATQRAHHVERATRPGDLAAVELLAAAAGEAAVPAPLSAAGWYDAALRVLPEGPPHTERRVALLRARARALLSADRIREARDALRQALDLLPPQAVRERAEVAAALGHVLVWMGAGEAAREALLEARAELADRVPSADAALMLELAWERGAAGAHEEFEACAEEARAIARAAGAAMLEAEAAVHSAEAVNLRVRGAEAATLEAADSRLDEATALLHALPDGVLAERLEALRALCATQLVVDRTPAAAESAERGLALARRTGQGLLAPAFLVGRGYAAEELGRLDAARDAGEEALESALVSGNARIQHWGSLLLTWVCLAQGRVEEAVGHAETAWRLSASQRPSSAAWTLADVRLAAGDAPHALAALEAGGWLDPRSPPRERVRALDVIVRALLAAGRVEDAEAWARRAPEAASGRRTGTFAAMIAHMQASVLLAREAAPEAAELALTGASEADDAASPLWAGRCRTLAGGALLAGGRRDDARAQLRSAAAELQARGATGYRDAALRVLRRLGDRPRPAATVTAPGVDGALAALTPREREVAGLVAEGQTNAQIALRLHLSERTVEKHVSSALGKLGTSTRAGIVALLARER